MNESNTSTMNESNTSTGHAVAGQAQQLAGQASDRAGTVVAQAGEQAKSVAWEAKDHARELVGRTRRDLMQQAEERSGQAAQGLRSLAGQFGALAEGRPHEAGPLTGYLRDAGDRIDRIASRMDQGPQAVLDDVKSFARRRPLVFLGMCGALGFAAGRLVRASSGDSAASGSNRLYGGRPEDGTYAAADPFFDGGGSMTAVPATGATFEPPYSNAGPSTPAGDRPLADPVPGEVLR